MDELLKQIEEKFGPKFDELNKLAEDLSERATAARDKDDAEGVKANTAKMEELEEQVKTLTKEHDAALREAEFKSLHSRVESLTEALETQRKPQSDFIPGHGDADTPTYGEGGEHGFYRDAKAVLESGDSDARERWVESLPGKAMTEGTGTSGGFLVPPTISSELLELREQDAVLRPLFSSVQVSSDTLRIASVESGLVAGWVAELAEKPSADLSFAELSVNTFTAAGLAVTSNQLLRDSNPSVDTLINRDLAKRLRAVEEVAFIQGSGVGQPLGIINTPGVDAVEDDSGSTAVDLLDDIQQAITNIYTEFLETPTAIVMHPRTWAYIVSAREDDSPTTYIVGPPGGVGRRPHEGIPGLNAGVGQLFGVNVYLTANIPTNLGGGTDESRVIVGAFSEGLILDHEGITLDNSKHVYFSTNQTIFRAEEQVGFTAARYPKAFSVVGGTVLSGV
jgi:HK97 family phage major capsid protein